MVLVDEGRLSLLDPAEKIGTLEKAGCYRTYIWGDPAKDLLGVILMQRNTGGDQADMDDEVNVFMAVAGRQYLVIPASSNLNPGGGHVTSGLRGSP